MRWLLGCAGAQTKSPIHVDGAWKYKSKCGDSDPAKRDQNDVRELCLLHLAIDDLDGIEEGHGGAEAGANLLNGVLGLGLADAGELLTAGLVFFYELLGEGAVLDLGEE